MASVNQGMLVAVMSIRFACSVEGRDYVEVSHVHVPGGGLVKSKYATVISLAHVVDGVYSAGHQTPRGVGKDFSIDPSVIF